MEKRKFHSGESIISLAAFPKNASNPILFGTCMSAGLSSKNASRRSSAFNKINTSNTSLYENNTIVSENTDTADESNSAIISFLNPRYSKVLRHQFSTVTTAPYSLEGASSSLM